MELNQNHPLLLGIDLGTTGVRAMAVSEQGVVAASAAVQLDRAALVHEGVCHEQLPEAWWQAVCRATGALLERLDGAEGGKDSIQAVSADGTSGTLVALDDTARPLRPAIMYNDARASAEAAHLNEVAAGFCAKLGYRFAASFALAKIVWLRQCEPHVFRRVRWFAHQADYVLWRLTGECGVSDYSNALKTGYDLVDDRWPAWVGDLPGVAERLPRVVPPGARIGAVTSAAARATGLPEGLPVVAGATDGTAAFLASGARRPGDYNTTLGTTLVFKGIAERMCRHPDGIIYCHKLPGGRWLPGAASNVGCQWIEAWFPGTDPADADADAASRLPSDCLAYPLVCTGERFPFHSAAAEGFFVPDPDGVAARYAACLQGTALVERLAYEVLDGVTGATGGEVYSTGGGSRSDVWMQCRADATGRVIHRPECAESALGAAILAASGANCTSMDAAVERMVRIERTFVPCPFHAARYNSLFERFREELKHRVGQP
jgi:D-ribulokinase